MADGGRVRAAFMAQVSIHRRLGSLLSGLFCPLNVAKAPFDGPPEGQDTDGRIRATVTASAFAVANEGFE